MHLAHESVYFDIQSLKGTVHLEFRKIDSSDRERAEYIEHGILKLNAKVKAIYSVKIKDVECQFQYYPFDSMDFQNSDVMQIDTLNYKKRFLRSVKRPYELFVSLPDAEVLNSEGFTVVITYSVYDEIIFRQANDVMYVIPQYKLNRCWMPCIENVPCFCTWDLYFSAAIHNDLLIHSKQLSFSLISSGTLVSQFIEEERARKIYHYNIRNRTSSSSIIWVCGFFEAFALGNIPNGFSFCPPGSLNACQFTMDFFPKMYEYYVKHLLECSFPHDSLKFVFVENLPRQKVVGASICLLSTEFLYNETVIDQTFSSRQIICECFAEQYFGIHYLCSSWSDIWLFLGLQRYQSYLGVRKLFGNNEFKFQLRHDASEVVKMDKNKPALCCTNILFPEEQINAFTSMKGALVIYMLNKRLGFGRLFLSKLISFLKIYDYRVISTETLRHFGETLSGKDLKLFFHQWVTSPGSPILSFSYSFNKKKNIIEMNFSQRNSNAGGKCFSGPLTIRVHESDGTFDHVVHLDQANSRFSLPYHTKYKKIKKRKWAPDLILDDVDDDDMDDDGKERKDRDANSSNALIAWIRIDPDFDWLSEVDLKQPDFVWADQLQRDRDVIAQYEAIKALEQSPSQHCSGIVLARTIVDTKYFYKIRMCAAVALSSCAIPSLEWHGLVQLLRVFSLKYCFPDHPNFLVPRPNDFSHVIEYFLQKGVIKAFRRIRYPDGRVPNTVVQFLLNILVFNDNNINMFADDYYISCVILTLASVLIPERSDSVLTKHPFLLDCMSEIERYRLKDLIFPSYHGIITVSCVEFLKRLQATGMINPIDINFYLSYSKAGNFPLVRKVAIEALFMFGNDKIDIVSYLIDVARLDMDFQIRKAVLRGMTKLAKNPDINFSDFLSSNQSLLLGLKSLLCELSYLLFTDLLGELLELLEYVEPGSFKDYFKNVVIKSVSFKDDNNLKYSLPSFVNIHELEFDIETNIEMDMEPLVSERKTTSEEIIQPLPIEDTSIIEEKQVMTPADAQELDTSRQTESAIQAPHLCSKDIGICRKILRKLSSYPESKPFLEPVDPSVALYHEIVEFPMDFSTLSANLEGHRYATFHDFGIDLSRIFENCFLYNDESSFFFNEGVKLQKIAIKEWKKYVPAEFPFPSALEADEAICDKSLYSEFWVSFCLKHGLDSLDSDFEDIEKFSLRLKPHRTGSHIRRYLFQLLMSLKFEWKDIVNVDTVVLFRELNYFFHIPLTREQLTSIMTVENSTSLMEPAEDISNSPLVDAVMIEPSEEVNLESLPLLKEDLRILLLRIVKMLSALPESRPFLFPVDPRVPNYYKVIKKPMDLHTMLVKALTYQYQDYASFKQDFYLICKNCQKFNPPDSYFYQQSEKLLEIYNTRIGSFARDFLDLKSTDFSETRIIIECAMDRIWNDYFNISGQDLLSIYPAWASLSEEVERGTFDQDAGLFNEEILKVLRKSNLGLNDLIDDYNDLMMKIYPQLVASNVKDMPETDSVQKKQVAEPQDISVSPTPPTSKVKSSTKKKVSSSKSVSNPPKSIERSFSKSAIDFKSLKYVPFDQSIALNIVNGILNDPLSEYFAEPVDPIALNIPNYLDIIRKPMDFGTIKKRVEASFYRDFVSLLEDVELVLTNCMIFNDINSDIYNIATDSLLSIECLIAQVSFPLTKAPPESDQGVMDYERFRKSLRVVLDRVKKQPFAFSFLKPVDPVALGIPKYFDIIRRPMDLETMSKKLESDLYQQWWEFEYDLGLICKNCQLFNLEGSVVYEMAEKTRVFFEEEVAKIKGRGVLIDAEKKTLEECIKKLKAEKFSAPFKVPVDAKKLNVPTYYQIIKNPMDLSTMSKKLRENEYCSVNEFLSDIDLIVNNCITFNGTESPLAHMARSMSTFLKDNLLPSYSNLRYNNK